MTTLFTLTNLYLSILNALDTRQLNAFWMFKEHAKRVDDRRFEEYGIPRALEEIL